MALSARNSQDFVPIKEVKNGIVVLKDGGLRAIVIVSSLNLSLKSAEEQTAIILGFQSFLNSLDFTTQIVVQSRKLDIRPYLLNLEERFNAQTEQLLKIQTREYIEFIRTFTEEVNIMAKTFFVVVPYESKVLKSTDGMIEKFIGGGDRKKIIAGSQKTKDDTSFEEKRTQIDQRVNMVIEGLSSIGLRSTQLKTEEIVELFYRTFNPGDINGEIKL